MPNPYRSKLTQSGYSWTAIVLTGLFFSILIATDTHPLKFRYPPLDPTTDGIRLLILKPGKKGTEIKCSLRVTTFGEKPIYEALSYEWGDPNQVKTINLHGSSINVRENLWDALDSLRDEKSPRTLWVDFLCIDQNNTAEKNKQIPLMAFIYRRAQQVIVWLGSHAQPVDERYEKKLGYTKNVDQKAKHAAEIGLEYFMHSLVHEEYWKRAWIVQEVGMASKITLNHGSGSMEWKEFIKLLRWYKEQNPNDTATEAILKLDNMRRSKFLQTESFSLQNLVSEFRDAFCELPHDKIYAFVGLANDTIDAEIPINYQKPVLEVYQDVMKHHFCSLSFETQQTSSVEAVYFAALVRRLLTREKIRRPREIRNLKEAITTESKDDYVPPPAQLLQKEVVDDGSRGGNHKDSYSGVSFATEWLYSPHYTTSTNAETEKIAKRRRNGKSSKDEQDEEQEEQEDKEENPWQKPLMIAIGIVAVAGLAWFSWKHMSSKPTENQAWCWKDPEAEDVTKWHTAEENPSAAYVLRGHLIGEVKHLGPSISDLTASHAAEKRWNARLGHYYRGSTDLAIARGLNEKLLSILSDPTDFQVRNISSLVPQQGRPSSKSVQNKSIAQVPEHPPVVFLGTGLTLGWHQATYAKVTSFVSFGIRVLVPY